MADLISLSEQLLLKVKMKEPTTEVVTELASSDPIQLRVQLASDAQKKAFWINCYNAFYQILRKNGLEKSSIYKTKAIVIAGSTFSLDDIEHGILRRFRWKPSLGYLPDPFVRMEIKQLAVDVLDWRIHFALNCGAKSCPPIAFYSADRIDQQLDLATHSFLETETEVIEGRKEIHVTRLMLWFSCDFGGRSGVRKILKEVLGLDTKGYKLKFKPYSWEDDLANFVDR